MLSRCVIGSEDLHFNVVSSVVSSAEFQPSHNDHQSTDVFINDEKTMSSLNNQSTIGEEFFEQLIDAPSFERLNDALKNDGINPDWFNDIPNELNQSTLASKAENQPFEGSLELLDEPTTQRFFQEIEIERFIDSTPEKQSVQNHAPISKTESQPIEITKREIEDISPPKSAKKRKNSEMSSCSSSSLNLENLPKEKQEIEIEQFNESNQNHVPKTNNNIHIADYCLILLLLHVNCKDPWVIWKDQSKLIFQIPSDKKDKVSQKWYEIKGSKSEKGCYKYFRQSIRYAINKSRDFDQITGEENFGQNLIFKFGERFKSRIFTLDCLNQSQMKIYKMILKG